MKDYAESSNEMIEDQLVMRGVSDRKVINAFKKVPRHVFVPEAQAGEAYRDRPLPIGEGQTISQPYIAAVMTELLDVKKTDRVLELGTGSGYQTAILAELAGDVYTIERIATLTGLARETLKKLGYKNIHFMTGDGTMGWAEAAPFDKIIVTAAPEKIPAPLLEQLSENGKMVIPVGERFSQELTLVEKEKGRLNTRLLGSVVFVPLIGRYGVSE
jgi:protein-L-isoaspartate(D-aspartate) O-methyltransferase